MVHTYMCTHTHVHIHVHTYMCTRTHAHVHTYTCTRTHVHVHTYTCGITVVGSFGRRSTLWCWLSTSERRLLTLQCWLSIGWCPGAYGQLWALTVDPPASTSWGLTSGCLWLTLEHWLLTPQSRPSTPKSLPSTLDVFLSSRRYCQLPDSKNKLTTTHKKYKLHTYIYIHSVSTYIL